MDELNVRTVISELLKTGALLGCQVTVVRKKPTSLVTSSRAEKAKTVREGEALGEAGGETGIRKQYTETVLVDLCGGVLDPYEGSSVTPDSLFCCFSVTKAVTSAVVHSLAARGLISLDDPVAKYWPGTISVLAQCSLSTSASSILLLAQYYLSTSSILALTQY